MDFIIAASNLRATIYGLKGTEDADVFKKKLSTITLPDFVPREGKLAHQFCLIFVLVCIGLF